MREALEMAANKPSRLVDICIEYVCQSFHHYVREAPDNSMQGRMTLQFGWNTCVLPARIIEQMLSRLNQLHMIDDYGQMLLRHPGLSGALKRIHLPGCFLTTTDLLSSMSNLNHLTDVNLAFCRCLPIGCQVLQHLLASAKLLVSLKLNFVEGDLGFDLLPLFTAMKDLDLSGTWLTTDHLVKAVQAMHSLESLDVSSTRVTMIGGLKAACCLPNLRSLGLHGLLVISEVEEAHFLSAQSELTSSLISSLCALKKVVYLDVSNPRFTDCSPLSRKALLNAVLTAPPALTEIDVSNFGSSELELELKGSPLLHQLLYVGCVQDWALFTSIASTQLETVAPHLKIGSLHCPPKHVGNILRSEYLKRPFMLNCLFVESFVAFLFTNVEDEATWSRLGELTLSALWLYRYDTEFFASAEFLAACFLHKCGEFPHLSPLVQRYVEFIAVCFDKVKDIQLLCLDLLDRSMQAVRRHAGLSVRVATFLVQTLKDFDASRMTCTEHSLLQCLHEVVSWNDFRVRSDIGFVIGAIELLISRLKYWSETSVDSRKEHVNVAVVVTEVLADLTDGIPDSGQRMLTLQIDCIQTLLMCLEAFSFNEAAIWGTLCVLGNMAEEEVGLSALLHHPSVVQSGIKYMLRKSTGDLVALAACHLIAVLLAADQSEWTDRLEYRDFVCHSLLSTLLTLQLYPSQSRNIGYTSIQPLLNMIKCKHVAEVRCFGMWMLASMCRGVQSYHYFTCLGDDSCAGLETVQNADIPPNMPKVFRDGKADIIDGYREWCEREQ